MDNAFNSETKKIVSALVLEEDSSYNFISEEIWYADPNEIHSYNKEKIQDITKVEVKFRKGNPEVMNRWGTQYVMPPCFYIPNKTELGINLIPESKEHKLVKNWIYNRMKNKKLKFSYSSVNKPFEYKNIINIEQLDVDFEKIGIEVNVVNNKVNRADVIMPFKKFHNFFGTGIVIEVQFSKQFEKTTKKRNLNWAFKGYSICWLWEDDFEKISDNFIELKEDILKLDILDVVLDKFNEKKIKDLRMITQEFSRQIDNKLEKLNYPFYIGECKICEKGYMTKKEGKGGKTDWYGCSNWRNGCKHTISIPIGCENDTDSLY